MTDETQPAPKDHEPMLCRNCISPTYSARTTRQPSVLHICVAHGRCECEAKDGHYQAANG